MSSMPKTLHELYQLKQDACTPEEWECRETLHYITAQHMQWNRHIEDAGQGRMPDGTYAYLYRPKDAERCRPVYYTKEWESWVKSYRKTYWRRSWDSEYNPLCAKDCSFGMTTSGKDFHGLMFCRCGQLFHGLMFRGWQLVPAPPPPLKLSPQFVEITDPGALAPQLEGDVTV
jgi:hypothetical protein